MTTTLLCVAFRGGKVAVGQLYGQATIAGIRAECATVLLTELQANSREKFAKML